MRLIDADKLKEELLSWARVISDPRLMATDDAMCVIDHAPTVAASPWHRVEDGLPYENTNALFYDENGYFHVGSMSRLRGHTEFIDYDGNTLHGVTHWMPIEPPKEDA